MFRYVQKTGQISGALFMTGILLAPRTGHATSQNFTDIARNISESIEGLPGLITSLSYLLGVLLGVMGIIKVKDHVENPQQTPLKDGAIRMAAGGALFALPIVFEAMQTTIGTTLEDIAPAALNPAEFSLR